MRVGFALDGAARRRLRVAIDELADVPVDLEGHEPGPRERPKPAAPAEAPVEPATEEREWFGGKPWIEWSRVTGDLGGVRIWLEDRGITVAGSYTMDWLGNVSGGVRRRGSYRHLIDANLTVDTDTLIGHRGGTFFVDFYSTSGDSIAADVGGAQGISNIETNPPALDQIAELWYEQWLFDDVVRIKAGKVDGAAEFGTPVSAGEFINPPAGVDATNALLPTYPEPATSLNLFVYPAEKFYLGVGWYDGALNDGVRVGGQGPATFFSDRRSDDWYFIGEVGLGWDELWFTKQGRIAAGGWGHTGDFARFDGGNDEGTQGFYVLAESMIWKRIADEADDERGLTLFITYGFADDDALPIGHRVGGGVTLVGTFDGRDSDAVGAMATWADLSDAPGTPFAGDELLFELFYKIQATGSIVVKPDVQVIFDPSGDSTLDSAVVVGVRVEVAF